MKRLDLSARAGVLAVGTAAAQQDAPPGGANKKVSTLVPLPDFVPGRRAERIRRKDKPRIPRWLRTILGIPLEMKLLGANLLGANLIIVGVAVLMLFGPVRLQSARLTGAYVVVAALIVGATVNFGLVRLALRPINTLERVVRRVSQGRFAERVPASIVADHELTQLSTTINEMLDSLAAGREQMRKLGAEVVYAEERERAQVARELHDSVGQTLTDASFQIGAAAQEIGSHAGSSRLAEVRKLLRTALEEIRNVSRSVHPRVATDLGLPTALEALGDATRHRSLVNVRPTSIFLGSLVPPAVWASHALGLARVSRDHSGRRPPLRLTAPKPRRPAPACCRSE